MDLNDERLLKILKLKEEFEKELRKMGKLREVSKKPKRPAPQKLNIDITPPANVDAADVRTVLEVNRQDYAADDESVVVALKRTLGKVGNVKRRSIIEGIMALLSEDYDAAEEVFKKLDDDEFRYMLGVTKLYRGDHDALEYAVRFLRERHTNYLPYLLLSEIFLSFGRYKDAGRFFEAAYKISRNPYIGLIYHLYSGSQDSRSLFPVCVNQGGYKVLLAMLSIYLEKDPDKAEKIARSLFKKNNACCKMIGIYWGGYEVKNELELFSYCPRIKLAKWARDFEEGKLETDPRKVVVCEDPLMTLFLGFYSMNIGEESKADEYFEDFMNRIEVVKIGVYRTSWSVKKLGIKQFYRPLFGETTYELSELTFKGIEEGLKEVAKKNLLKREELDVGVEFKDPEILRLFFGQRHCKHLYKTV